MEAGILQALKHIQNDDEICVRGIAGSSHLVGSPSTFDHLPERRMLTKGVQHSLLSLISVL